jgi:tRNA G18 (ribose-2'-O)-methylase SpoU
LVSFLLSVGKSRAAAVWFKKSASLRSPVALFGAYVQIAERITRVESLDDPRLADYRKLREADLMVRREAFIAESEVVLRVLLERGRFAVRSVLIAESRLPKLSSLLLASDSATPVYVAEQALLSEVVGFKLHRGILASGQREPVPSPEQLLSALGDGPRRVVVLEGLTNHDNVGGVFRNAAAFGADAVLYDARTCDPLYRKAIRVSVGAALFMPFARAEQGVDIVRSLQSHGFRCLALSPRADATDLGVLCKGGVPQRVALLLGSEGPGLSEACLHAADEVVRIAIEPGFDSLNVATTSGIALHALREAHSAQQGGRGQARKVDDE